ncbi:MAG TPA: hypothetical protein ENK18_06060 [Deltaproteobacteria bacterium]|nr:hypothetical protein [Deltaproteobacteria bacterium]
MDQIQIAWEIHSDQGLELGGWTIDDVCIYAPATADNRLGIVDFVVTDLGGPIGLTWTNPVHGPIDEVVVVRRTDRYPDGMADGEIVATVTDAVPGAPSEAEHPNYDGSAGYYAVYAGDGAEWLSWTVEGWNAGFMAANEGQDKPIDTAAPTDTGTGTDGTDDPDPGTGTDPGGTDDKEPGGCGCAASPASGVPWLALGLLGLLSRRRR